MAPAAWAHGFIEAVIVGLELAAAVVVVAGAAGALVGSARVLRHRTRLDDVRVHFGRAILLALDFTIGSDVLRLGLVPDLRQVAVAGLAVLLRAVLTFVLEYELRRHEGRRAA